MLHVLREAGLADRVQIDSAGTSSYHVGSPADPRARETARERGYDLPSISRQFEAGDFARFDYVLAMDTENVEDLRAIAPDEEARGKIHLFRSFDPDAPHRAEVPDPYYGGPSGFEVVFDLCEAACRGLLAHLQETYDL